MGLNSLMEKAVPEIEKLARHFNVEESRAVEAYGYLLQVSEIKDGILSFDNCTKIIRSMLLKPVVTLTHEEARVGLCLNLLRVKQKPFLSDSVAKVGRNALCPCGSGLKFKKCCLSSVRKHEYERYISGTTIMP